jgi:hypothetical protein
MGGALKFTIDTEIDSYEDALRTVQAAYGRTDRDMPSEMSIRAQMRQERQGLSGPVGEVVWRTARGWTVWTEPMLRAWVDQLADLESLSLAWRLFCDPGPPGVRGSVLAAYLAPGLPEKQASSHLARISRRLNKAARDVGADSAPVEIVESSRMRIADRRVAAIVMDQLAASPLWPQVRRDTDSFDGPAAER